MNGFIKKDLAMIKSNFKLLGVLLLICLITGLFSDMDVSFILPFLTIMIMITTFSYDSFNKWDAYAITLPNGRQNSVKAKYVATIVMILIASIITIILSFIVSYIKTKMFNYEDILLQMAGTVFATLLVLSFMYPVIYKFGVEKARIGIFIIIFGIVVLGGLLLKFVNTSNMFNALSYLDNYILMVILLVTIIMIYLSYKISKRIYMKKEF